MTLSEVFDSRRSVPGFDASVSIDREELLALMNHACLAPSSMNMQPWAFMICHTPDEKARLQKVSFNQKKISEASAAVVLLGNMRHHENAARVADSNIQLGYFGPERKERYIESARNAWGIDPVANRDEMFRGGSLWAMSFMLLAKEAGWDTAPMGGFDRAQMAAEFSLPDDRLPVLVIAIGKVNPTVTMLPRSERIPVEELLHPAS
jgi:putative NAD(P)H nitroreductase